MIPELRQKPRLLSVVGGADRAAEQYESAVTLARTDHLPRMPRERRTVKRDEYQAKLRASDQQCGIVQAKP